MHAWTQSDRYAIALMFLENGFKLFKPQTFNLETIDGVIAADFPIVEFFVALLMKLTGNTEPIIYRGFLLSLSIVGHFFLFRTARFLGYAIPTAIWIMVFSFTMPILLHYQAGFIPSVSAFAFFLIGLYFATKDWKSSSGKTFYWAMGFFLLAALIRKPFVMFAFAYGLMHVFPLNKNRKRIVASFIAALIFIGYFIYNTYLNNTYGSALLTSATSAEGLGHWYTLILEISKRWAKEFLSIAHYVIVLAAIIMSLIKWRNLNTYLIRYFLITLLLGIIYFNIMISQFIHHEYYFIDCLYPSVVILLLFIASFIIPYNKYIKWVLALGIIISLLKYADPFLLDKFSNKVWDRGAQVMYNYEGSEDLLNALNIPKEAKLLCIDVHSTNRPLIWTNRKGYTLRNTKKEKLREAVEEYTFDYIIVQNQYYHSDIHRSDPEFVNQLKYIGSNKGITVASWENAPTKQEVAEFLDFNTARSYSLKDSTLQENWSNVLYTMDETNEYGLTFSHTVQKERNTALMFSVNISEHENCSIPISFVVSRSGRHVQYLEHYINGMSLGDQSFVFPIRAELKEGDIIKCYLWNKNKCALKYLDATVRLK